MIYFKDEEEIKAHMESHEICMVFSCKHCNYQVPPVVIILSFVQNKHVFILLRIITGMP
jgi:hypothetical protein